MRIFVCVVQVEKVKVAVEKSDNKELAYEFTQVEKRLSDGGHITSVVTTIVFLNTFKYHVFAPMGRFQLESIYLYFPPSSQLVYLCFCPVGLSLL